jgi:ATP-dependent Clp protease ATP-binding subunit ClpC
VFERFTERARQVVVLAQKEARALKHNYIGTEHILLGLIREDEGIAARVLESFDVTAEEVRAQVARIVGQGDEVLGGQMPFTRRGKRVLERSLDEAIALNHNYIGTEHLLLALTSIDEGVAVHILVGLGVDPDKIRNEVARTLSGPARRAAPPGAPAPARDNPPRPEPPAGLRLTGGGRVATASIHRGPDPRRLLIVSAALFAVGSGVGLFLGWLIWG